MSYGIIYMQNLFLKSDTNEFIYKREKDSQTSRMNLWLSVGEGRGRDRLGVWDQHVDIAICKIDTQQGSTV